MSRLPDHAIRRRVVHLGGYDPMPPQAYHRRFQRELNRFRSTWAVSVDVAPLVETDEQGRWNVAAGAPGWQSQTEHLLLRWDDVIEADRQRGWLTRLPLGLASFADFIWHGALWRYLRIAWRYAGFFIYPFLVIGLLAVIALLIADGAIGLLAMVLPLASMPVGSVLAGITIALGSLALLLHWLGARLYLDHLVDDWIYASNILRHGDRVVEARLDRLAVELVGNSDPDAGEILVVGHSLGSLHAAELIARVIRLAPDGPPIRFASVGSSILKIGLHRGAKRLKAVLAEIAQSPRVIWCEFHALNDVMNFYKSEPMAVLGLPGPPAMTRVVKFRPMLEPAYYRRMERNFFRLHCQFISGNDRRAPYDYFMMLLGPFPMEELVRSPEGAIPWIAGDGGLTDAAKPHLTHA
jgi:hypothetical protein